MNNTISFQKPVKQANIYFIGAVAALAGLLFGFDTGVISGAQDFIFSTFGIGNETIVDNALHGLIVSAVPFGALLGAMVSGVFAKRLGRKQSIMMTALMFMVGTSAAAFAPSLESIVLGRLIMGLAIGISAMVVPMYLGEVSPSNIRGKIIFLFQLAITIGIFGAFAVNLLFAEWIEDTTMNWRWMFGMGFIPALILFIGMRKMPLSPRWLMLQNRKEEARYELQSLLGKIDVEEEVSEIEESMKHETGSNWSALFKKPIFPLILVSFGLFVFQQLSGINAIMYYGPKVFANSGFGEKAKFTAQALMGLTNVIATIFGVWIVDKLGRRSLLFIGFLGMIACLGVLAFCLNQSGNYAQLSLVSTLLYVVFFAISMGGVPYIMMSEVFPLNVRASGMAVASCANWGFNMLVSFTFEILVTKLGGMSNVFMLYAVCTVVGLIFAMRFVPETKGRKLEEIEHNLYEEGKSVRYLGDPVSYGIRSALPKVAKKAANFR